MGQQVHGMQGGNAGSGFGCSEPRTGGTHRVDSRAVLMLNVMHYQVHHALSYSRWGGAAQGGAHGGMTSRRQRRVAARRPQRRSSHSSSSQDSWPSRRANEPPAPTPVLPARPSALAGHGPTAGGAAGARTRVGAGGGRGSSRGSGGGGDSAGGASRGSGSACRWASGEAAAAAGGPEWSGGGHVAASKCRSRLQRALGPQAGACWLLVTRARHNEAI